MIYVDMESFYKRVYVRLIEIEKKRSWLLSTAGIKPSTWSSWEKFARMPPADRALAVADALGVSLEFLVTGRETPFDLRRTHPLVTQICRQLTEMGEGELRQAMTAVNSIRIGKSRP
jgi:transcriptional regulator with XRE-family HTH domain